MDGVVPHFELVELEHPGPVRPLAPDIDFDLQTGDLSQPTELHYVVRGSRSFIEAHLLVDGEEDIVFLGEVSEL